MARHLFNRLTFTCAATLWLTGCGGRTADIDDDLVPSSGGTASGGWLGVGGTKANGGATIYAYGGWGQGGYISATGGYNYWATGGYRATGGYYYVGGKAATGGYRATGGYPFGTGGKATGGKGGYAGMPVPYYGGGTAGRPPIAGGPGFWRGGSGGTAGVVTLPAGGPSAGGKPATGGAPPGAGAAGCPAIGCINNCPLGYWSSLDGCMSCACVPPDKKLSYDTLACPAQSLTVSVIAQQQTGTWVFNFAWTCTATATALGQPLNASVGVTIFNDSTDPITSTNRTITYNPAASSVPIVFSNPQLVVTGSGLLQITVPLTPSSGAYLSIRREGSLFVGGLYLPATQTGGTTSVMLAGSFSVAVP